MNSLNNAYSVEGNKVFIGNQVLTFDYPISESIELTDMLIVRLEKPIDIIYNENVFGISINEGRIKWRIAKRDYVLKNCPFVKVNIFEGHLVLVNWCSFYLYVNPLNGEILREEFSK